MLLAPIGLALAAGPYDLEDDPPPPTPPRADLFAEAEARGAAGFYAARDVAALDAMDAATGDDSERTALLLLADTAARTGDWSRLDGLRYWPTPGACACDTLALHAAAALHRHHLDAEATAWLALIPAGSASWPDAQLLRAAIDRSHAIAILEAIPAPGPAHDRAVIQLALPRCTPATWPAATALLDTVAPSLDLDLARAWCATNAGHPADLAPLDARPGAWIPSLPLLHAFGDRAALETVRTHYAELWAQLGQAAEDILRDDDLTAARRRLFATLPAPLVAQLRTSTTLRGLEGRFRAIAAEEARTKDPTLREDLAYERDEAELRVNTTLGSLVEDHAREIGRLHELTSARIATLDHPPQTGPELAATLHAMIAQQPPAKDRGAMAARLAFAELGAVPTATTLDTLRVALADPTPYPQRERAAWTLALTLIDAGRSDEAEATLVDLAAATPRSPLDWQAVALLGDLAFARQDFARADDAYLSATLAPDRPLALYATYRRAWCAWAQRRPKAAASLIAQVLADPATPADLRASALAEQRRLGRCRTFLGCPHG